MLRKRLGATVSFSFCPRFAFCALLSFIVGAMKLYSNVMHFFYSDKQHETFQVNHGCCLSQL